MFLMDSYFAWAWMALRVRNASPSGRAIFNPQEDVPRTLAGSQSSVWSSGGLPVRHGAESTWKDPRPEEKKKPKSEKNTFIYSVYI